MYKEYFSAAPLVKRRRLVSDSDEERSPKKETKEENHVENRRIRVLLDDDE